MAKVNKICPTSEELSTIRSQLRCTEEGCTSVFQCSSNLNMHLIKHHGMQLNNLSKNNTFFQYVCPIKLCDYSESGRKHFNKLKYLKQHFLKVHAMKTLECGRCNKRFSTESFLNLHIRSCGKVFTCICGAIYNSSEAILTHCKRKGNAHSTVKMNSLNDAENHKIIQNYKSISKPAQPTSKKCERVIYPKLHNDMSFPIHYIAAIALSELSAPCNLPKLTDRGVQTDGLSGSICQDDKQNICLLKLNRKRKNSQQTQTVAGKSKKIKISAETQTSCDFLKHKHKQPHKSITKKRKNSIETQTRDNVASQSLNVEAIAQRQISSIKDSKDLSHGSLSGKIFNDSLTTYTSNARNGGNKEQQDHQKEVLAGIQASSKSLKETLDEIQTRKWVLDTHFFSKTSPSFSSLTLVKGINHELSGANHELGLYNKDLDGLNLEFKTKEKNPCTETTMFDISRLCNIETQTEMNTFLTEANEDTSFTLCSTTQTQTTDDFDSLLYSNMCTQTCEEVDHFFNFNFVDIETQTAWPDLN